MFYGPNDYSSTDTSLQTYATLLEWMTQNGGHLHESVQIAKDDRRGVHLQVKEGWGSSIPNETCIINTPLPATMSYFNAVNYRLPSEKDDVTAVFSDHGVHLPRAFIDAVGPEESTVFFLMGQYLRGSDGFWFPWIQTLPQPGALTTPLYYEGRELEWLKGTSLMLARAQKLGIMMDKCDIGVKKLREAGFADVERYTW